jgi:hypothetical protein
LTAPQLPLSTLERCADLLTALSDIYASLVGHSDVPLILTTGEERGIWMLAAPWKVGHAPSDFVAAQMGGIIGAEIPVFCIEGGR